MDEPMSCRHVLFPLPPCSGRIVEFAEKPKGDALKKMQVDTTILGLDKEA